MTTWLTGRTALRDEGRAGIGREVALWMAKDGVPVALVARSPEQLRRHRPSLGSIPLTGAPSDPDLGAANRSVRTVDPIHTHDLAKES